MLETISQFLKDWGAMDPSRRLSIVLLGLLVCAFFVITYFYKKSERSYTDRDGMRVIELRVCKEENRVLQDRYERLQGDFTKYLMNEKLFKIQVRDSLK